MRRSAEIQIPMDELMPQIRRKTSKKATRPNSELITGPNSSATPPPPLPPRPNSMVSSVIGSNNEPQIPQNYYPPPQESNLK